MATELKAYAFKPILIIIALSFALNLHGLAADSFWGDEILTASFAARPPGEVITWTADDIHPPLYYLIVGAFTHITVPLGTTILPSTTSDWLWRFQSALAGVLTVTITYNLARQIARFCSMLKERRQLFANSAALLFCLAPIVIKYGQEARMHALFMLFAALSTWLLFRAVQNSGEWTLWLAFALATTATIYTMYFGFLIIAAQVGFALALIIKLRITDLAKSPPPTPPKGGRAIKLPPLWRPKEGLRGGWSLEPKIATLLTRFGLAITLALLLYLPWWPVLLNILRKRAAVGAIEGGVGAPADFVAGVIAALGPAPTAIAWGFLLLFAIGLLLLTQRFWPLAVFGGLWLAFPVLLPIFLGDPRALQFRYAFVLPLYLTIIAYAVIKIGQQMNASKYLIWLLATLSFMATLNIYQQVKPNWRDAAAYLNQHTSPADIILIGPLWDEGRFIGYYYRGQAQLLTPAALVTNIQGRAEGLRAGNGHLWAVNRFAPAESPVSKNVYFAGVVISEPQLAVYEPALLTEATLDLAAQAVDAAYPWAAEAEAQGILNPDPRTAQAAALRAWGDVLVAAGRPAEALIPYQKAVNIFPGWVSGFIALAEAHEAVGNLAEAAQAYQQAVTFNLKWQGAEAEQAAKFINAGNWSAAVEKYHQIIGQ